MCWFSRKYKLASQKEAAVSRLHIFVGLSSHLFKPKRRELLPGLVLYILISIYSILSHTWTHLVFKGLYKAGKLRAETYRATSLNTHLQVSCSAEPTSSTGSWKCKNQRCLLKLRASRWQIVHKITSQMFILKQNWVLHQKWERNYWEAALQKMNTSA